LLEWLEDAIANNQTFVYIPYPEYQIDERTSMDIEASSLLQISLNMVEA